MRFEALPLAGVMLIRAEPSADARGSFARIFCEAEFAAAGLPARFPQANLSFNHRKGTVRGMHYQAAPREEAKVVRCTRGAIHDVLIDLRPESPTYRQSMGVELTAENRLAIYLPARFAHGFQTLVDENEVLYLMGESYDPDLARGVRWNDPAFHVSWPLAISLISERDATYPDFEP